MFRQWPWLLPIQAIPADSGPEIILMLQAIGMIAFWFTGKSDVTGAVLDLYVLEDRI